MQQGQEMTEYLQEELVKVRLKETQNGAIIRDLRSIINELEGVNKYTTLEQEDP